uniref:hypothetical protein n=1 Tax=Cephaleuros karstenii TaxID=1985640 RepID=UPI001EDCC941|nr:hypothetical protein MFR52_pgp057 [Cephaleuros karstenii]UIB39102.1 hypothetical protein [Cephaleuros karstenii]
MGYRIFKFYPRKARVEFKNTITHINRELIKRGNVSLLEKKKYKNVFSAHQSYALFSFFREKINYFFRKKRSFQPYEFEEQGPRQFIVGVRSKYLGLPARRVSLFFIKKAMNFAGIQ